MRHQPRPRTEGLVIQPVDDELIVYDRQSHQAHNLTSETASVWKHCNGRRSADEIGRELGLQPELVEQALSELGECGLLDEGPVAVRDYSRREAAAKMVKVGGVAFAAPLIYSAVIQPAVAAASCKALGQPVTGCPSSPVQQNASCCSGLCASSVCVACAGLLGSCTHDFQCCPGIGLGCVLGACAVL